MKKIILIISALISFQTYSQVQISEIFAYPYDNKRNSFSPNVVGKESIDVNGSTDQTLIVVKLNRVPNVDYKAIERKLKVTALYEGKDKVDIYDTQELIITHLSETFYAPLLLQTGTTDITIKAELFEEGKLVFTKKQFLVTWSGD